MPTQAGRRTILAATSAVDVNVDVAATQRLAQPVPAVRPPPAARLLSPSLLLLILIGQACLSARLIWANTAFQDEALYLWAGRLELAHWLHGASIPAFPTYFSGAPALYPPLGALANNLGGLAAARILSLLLMLGATALLWCTASMLFGQAGGVLLRRAVGRARADAAARCVRDLRRAVAVPDGRRRLLRGQGRPVQAGNRVDARRRGGADGSQRRLVLVPAL